MINCVFGLCVYLTEQRIVAMETGTLGHGYQGNRGGSLTHSLIHAQALVLRHSVPEKVSVNKK